MLLFFNLNGVDVKYMLYNGALGALSPLLFSFSYAYDHVGNEQKL